MHCQHCQHCDAETELIECPSCGALLQAAPPRSEQNRPIAEKIAVVESSNYNGEYDIYKLSDGAIFCNCLSFLYQRGTSNGDFPFMTCKHIRSEMGNYNFPNFKFQAPSDYQRAYLRKLGVNIGEHLTNAQAYFILDALLRRQGLRYDEFKALLLEHPKVNFLPLNHFGVEFEGGLGCSKEQFKEKLAEAGIESIITSYDHTLYNKVWKLGNDSSVSIPDLHDVELTSPKLSGYTGFEEIAKVLTLWNETLPFRNGREGRIPGVNRTCGTHVHVDAHGWTVTDFLRLAKVWAKMEVPVIWHLVSPSRRGGRYCRAIDVPYLESLENGYLPGERYYSLNLEAFRRQESIEYRIHNGTLEGRKIISWIIFLLMLTDAVKKGLSHNDFEPSFDGVMDAVGMSGSNTTPLIKEARRYLWKRYLYWQREDPVPSSAPRIDLVRAEREIRERVVERRRSEINARYSSRRTGLTTYDSNFDAHSVHNLASLRPASIIPPSDFFSLDGESRWLVPSRSGNGSYTVVHNTTDDTLHCNCRGFRTHRHCYHSINLARHIITQRLLAEEAVQEEVASNV